MIRRLSAPFIALVLALVSVAAPSALAQTRAAPAPAASAVGTIAAVVNDDVITVTDLQLRLRLALMSSGLPASQENQQRMLPQVLRLLIDEKLQGQEASRTGVAVPAQDVDKALASIAGQNHLSTQQLFTMLKSTGVPQAALEDQVRAQLAWRQLVQRRFVSQVEVSDTQIDEVVERLRANQGKPQYLVASIFLAVDQDSNDAQVRALADRLVSEVRKGAPFPAVARQFSQAAGAQNGGDMGWVLAGQLEPALDQVLGGMTQGQVSDPIRTLGGYNILLVRDKRVVNAQTATGVKVRLNQIVVPVPSTAPANRVDTVVGQMRNDFKDISGCEAFRTKVKELGVTANPDLGDVLLSRLPQGMRQVVSGLADGQVSPPMRVSDGVAVMMVCSRADAGGDGIDRDQIRAGLAEQRIDMMQRRLLRDLRGNAYIDIRL
ncbi:MULTISPECIES: peptidylprolyl isomerase [Inquilinus]|uniref:Parvulin-like PPIase n=1 Tax=Inquilinus ginsengisoli TaxID=363840 RepID=A0ABU1JW24_9PROT|nr:peptidylprolyl isomerase [Inquilinus ginsengisoli]MDR6292822.1 peptidyl-prolyl cis-trans isomerase SurA [Inquilinus ginsengisoli]